MKKELAAVATGTDKNALVEWLTDFGFGSVPKRSAKVAIAPYSDTDGPLQCPHVTGSGVLSFRASPLQAVQGVTTELPAPERRRFVHRESADQDHHATGRGRCPELPAMTRRSKPPWRRCTPAPGRSQTPAGNNSRRRGTPVLCTPRTITD